MTYSDYVVDRLRADILGGAFPPTTRLPMKDLCERYEVGTSPIREALNRLTGEGFVQVFGQRGFRVPPLSIEDLTDLTELRLLVEEAIVRQALAHGDDAWEARIVAAFHRLERQIGRFQSEDELVIRDYDRLHRHFHLALYEDVASPRMSALHANLFDQAFRYRKLLHREPIDAEEVLREHRELMQHVLSRNAEAAIQAVCGHLQLTVQAAKRQLRPEGGQS